MIGDPAKFMLCLTLSLPEASFRICGFYPLTAHACPCPAHALFPRLNVHSQNRHHIAHRMERACHQHRPRALLHPPQDGVAGRVVGVAGHPAGGGGGPGDRVGDDDGAGEFPLEPVHGIRDEGQVCRLAALSAALLAGLCLHFTPVGWREAFMAWMARQPSWMFGTQFAGLTYVVAAFSQGVSGFLYYQF